jgi:hypothetical protein
MEALRELISRCQSLEANGYADLPEASTPTGKVTVAALNAEAVLDSSIRPETTFESTTEPAHIFLTGTTGFVGAFLLYELLQQTTADIYCLVRSPNTELGKKRLQSHLESYLLWMNRSVTVLSQLWGICLSRFWVFLRSSFKSWLANSMPFITMLH